MDQQDSSHETGLDTAADERRQPSPAMTPLADDVDTGHDEIAWLRTALTAAQARERALSHELQHRVRNMLAVIRSIYRRSRENGASQDEFAEHFEGRLTAVARYQSHVDEVGSGVEIEDMVRNELLGLTWLDGPNCSISGPRLMLNHKQAELLGLAIHELATNSIKFGALGQGGQLEVAWSAERHEGPRRLDFRWVETGVSVASSAPRPSGFGRQLIEEALPYQLGATTSFELKPGGLTCTIALSVPDLGGADRDDALDDPLSLPLETE